MNTVKVDVVKRKSALWVAANDPVWDFDCRECKSNSYVATDGTITHIHYNASGQRIAESDNDGNVLLEYIYLGQQAIALAITNGDSKTTYFIHNDHLGTPKLLTNTSGTVVWQQHTTPFGEIQETLATGINNLKSFPGQYRDSETGYSYNYFRDYDPSLGRYIQSDPIGLEGGLNTYGYVSGNPIILFDPYGLVEIYNEDGVSIHAFPKGDNGQNESACHGPHGDYHIHVNPGNGPKKIVKTVIDPETHVLTLVPEDPSKLTKKELKVLNNFSQKENRYIYKSCREVFHNNWSPSTQKRLRLKYLSGPFGAFFSVLTDNSHTLTCEKDLTGALGDVCY